MYMHKPESGGDYSAEEIEALEKINKFISDYQDFDRSLKCEYSWCDDCVYEVEEGNSCVLTSLDNVMELLKKRTESVTLRVTHQQDQLIEADDPEFLEIVP